MGPILKMMPPHRIVVHVKLAGYAPVSQKLNKISGVFDSAVLPPHIDPYRHVQPAVAKQDQGERIAFLEGEPRSELVVLLLVRFVLGVKYRAMSGDCAEDSGLVQLNLERPVSTHGDSRKKASARMSNHGILPFDVGNQFLRYDVGPALILECRVHPVVVAAVRRHQDERCVAPVNQTIELRAASQGLQIVAVRDFSVKKVDHAVAAGGVVVLRQNDAIADQPRAPGTPGQDL